MPTLPGRKHGFTLIEMIIVIALLSVLTGTASFNYVRYNREQELINAGQETAQFLRETQKKARSGEKPEACGIVRLLSYRVTTRAVAPRQMRSTPRCAGRATTPNDFTLPEGLIFAFPREVDFFPLSENGGARNFCIRRQSETPVRWYVISVTPEGLINEIGFRNTCL